MAQAHGSERTVSRSEPGARRYAASAGTRTAASIRLLSNGSRRTASRPAARTRRYDGQPSGRQERVRDRAAGLERPGGGGDAVDLADQDLARQRAGAVEGREAAQVVGVVLGGEAHHVGVGGQHVVSRVGGSPSRRSESEPYSRRVRVCRSHPSNQESSWPARSARRKPDRSPRARASRAGRSPASASSCSSATCGSTSSTRSRGSTRPRSRRARRSSPACASSSSSRSTRSRSSATRGSPTPSSTGSRSSARWA